MASPLKRRWKMSLGSCMNALLTNCHHDGSGNTRMAWKRAAPLLVMQRLLDDVDDHERGDQAVGGHRVGVQAGARRRRIAAGDGLPLGEVDGRQRRRLGSVAQRGGDGPDVARRQQVGRRRQQHGDLRGGGVDSDHPDMHARRRGGRLQGALHCAQRHDQDVAALRPLDAQPLRTPPGRRGTARRQVLAGGNRVGGRGVESRPGPRACPSNWRRPARTCPPRARRDGSRADR